MKTSLLASLLLALAIYAAASPGASPKIDESALAQMHKGQTTYDEIVRRFGRPNFGSKSWDGRTAAYAYAEGWSPNALTALNAALGSSTGDTVVLYFNSKDVLTDYKINQATANPQAGPTVRYVEPSSAGVPTIRYVEPPAAGPGGSAAAKPAQATTATPSPTVASKPVPVEIRKPRKDDDLPWWLPSTSTREDRY